MRVVPLKKIESNRRGGGNLHLPSPFVGCFHDAEETRPGFSCPMTKKEAQRERENLKALLLLYIVRGL